MHLQSVLQNLLLVTDSVSSALIYQLQSKNILPWHSTNTVFMASPIYTFYIPACILGVYLCVLVCNSAWQWKYVQDSPYMEYMCCESLWRSNKHCIIECSGFSLQLWGLSWVCKTMFMNCFHCMLANNFQIINDYMHDMILAL